MGFMYYDPAMGVLVELGPTGGKLRSHALTREIVTLGRTPDNDIVLADDMVSGRHAVILTYGSSVTLEDKGSRNGTFVNKLRILTHRLQDGDLIRIGRNTLRYEERLPESIEVAGREADPARGSRMVEAAPDALFRTQDRNFVALYDLSIKLGGIQDSQTMIDWLLETTLLYVKADQGVILLHDRARDAWTPRASFPRRKGSDLAAARVSQTVLQRVLQTRGAILVQNVAGDEEIMRSNVAQPLGSQSILAIPLAAENEVRGVVYLSGTRGPDQFNQQDLQLLTVIGRLGGVALERALLGSRLEEVKRAKARLEAFFPPEILGELAPGKSVGETFGMRRVGEATVMFCDISGFTERAESMEPSEAAALLNEYYTVGAQTVFKHGGIVDKYVGDGIMAVFGVPHAKPDDAVRAATAACELLEATGRLGGARPIRVRIGLNTGLVVAGLVGGANLLQYTVLGDTVNVASRLEGMATPGTVLVGGSTWEKIKHAFEAKRMGETTVRGRSGKVDAYTLAGPRA